MQYKVINAKPAITRTGQNKINVSIIVCKQRINRIEVVVNEIDMVVVKISGGIIGDEMLVVSVYLCPSRR